MSKSAGLKIIAMLLTAAFLLGTAACGLGVVYLAQQGLYGQTLEERDEGRMENVAFQVSLDVAQIAALDQYYPEDDEWIRNVSALYEDDYWYTETLLGSGLLLYTVLDENGTVITDTYQESAAKDFLSFDYMSTGRYPVAVVDGSEADWQYMLALGLATEDQVPNATTAADPETIPPVTWPAEENTQSSTLSEPDAEMLSRFSYDRYQNIGGTRYHIYFFQSPVYEIRLWLSPDAYSLVYGGFYYESEHLTGQLYPLRHELLALTAGLLLVSLAGIVYLCWVSGRKQDSDEVAAVGLNRLPLDLYGCAVGGLGFLLFYFCFLTAEYGLFQVEDATLLYLSAALFYLLALVALVYLYAVSAQLKLGGGFWWKNTLIGRFCRWIWKYVKLLFRALLRLIGLIPLIWQWPLIAGVLVLLLLVSFQEMRYGSGLPFLLVLALTFGVIAYLAYAFGVLVKGARRMAKGDLTKKVPTRFLFGFFRRSANDLNALADVAVVAAQRQLRSERMKTELITNVSHDIKTPLTSIINFVDLLQKPHTKEQEAEYLAVLDRQSQRLKKLIEDLMEMSKASTGNIQVNITAVDACEAVNQALGEFSDKLAVQHLIPVVRLPEKAVPMAADGRLVWRVLSNVLSNVVKYALPGTRVYVDVVELEEKVLISVKNISREELNVSAEELMERFVRGDASRNTEGSGLGLNIAKSLMDVQHGLMQLLVDGDLFKVTLIFPAA